jgi:hypothetical protein
MKTQVRTLAMVFAVGASALVTSAVQADIMYGLNATGTNVFTVDTATPGALVTAKAITGMTANEQIMAIDVRPVTGALYGLSSFGNVYVLNSATGAATLVGAGSGSPNGVNFGIDFNPTVDLIRAVSDTGDNSRISPVTGATVGTDVDLGATANVIAVGYTNNFVGAASTVLYGLDSGTNNLVTFVGNPNAGVLSNVGPVGVDFSSVAGLDIVGANNTAYAALQPVNSSISYLYAINLATGAGALLGQIGGGFEVRDIAVAVPEPASLALLALAAPALLTRRRKA